MSSIGTVSLPARSGRRRLSLRIRHWLWGYVFISPWLIGFLVFSAGPILAIFYLSFTEYSVFAPPQWLGLRNYAKLFTDDALFPTSLYNTAYYVALAVPGQMLVAFVAALLLNIRVRGLTVFRTVYYMPVLVPYVVSSVVFVWLMDPQVGILKYMLSVVGVVSPDFLHSEAWAKPAIAFLSFWGMGGTMLIFLAGLQGIPDHLYEVAEIDGAGALAKLRHVTIPLMTPTILFNLIMGIIGSFQVFTFAYIMTRGGPLNSTLFYVLYIYRHAFEFFRMGYAAALAAILFLCVLAVTVIIFRWSRSWVYYEGVAPGERGQEV